MQTSMEIVLRKANAKDSKKLWEWRNHPDIRKNFFDDQAVAWEDHRQWFEQKIKANDTRIYIAVSGNVRIGVIRFEADDNGARVSVNLDPGYLGRGLGARVIKEGTEIYLNETRPQGPIIAEIKRENVASQKAFRNAGYQFNGKINGKVIYQKCAE